MVYVVTQDRLRPYTLPETGPGTQGPPGGGTITVPFLFWRFQETSGNRFDSVQGFPMLPLTANTGFTPSGVCGNAIIDSPGTLSGYVNNNQANSSVAFTMGLWFKANSFPLAVNWVAARVYSPANSMEWRLTTQGTALSATQNVWLECSQNNTTFVTVSNTIAVATGAWHSVLFWFDPAGPTMNLMVDNGAVQSLAWIAGGIPQNGGRLYVENVTTGGGIDSYAGPLDGAMDNVCFWQAALPPEERTAWWNGGSGQEYYGGNWHSCAVPLDLPAPTTFFTMGGAAGAAEVDTVASLSMAQSGGVGSAAGKVGNARSFVTASSQYLSIADNAAFQWNTTVTVALWVNLTDKTTFRYFLYKGVDNTTTGQDYGLLFHSTNNDIEFNWDDTAFNNYRATLVVNPSAAIWYCLGMQWNGTNMNVSVNGAAWSVSAMTALPASFGGPFQIGARNTASGLYMNGLIDAVGIWKGTMLTSAQIANFYNAGNGREWTGSAWNP
jgi:hypothetical protein